MGEYFVYIMTNRSKTLYTGMTNNLSRRIEEHRSRRIPGFTRRYSIDKLVFYEQFDSPGDALIREKQIKGWRRSKKLKLIESINPDWIDLTEEISPG